MKDVQLSVKNNEATNTNTETMSKRNFVMSLAASVLALLLFIIQFALKHVPSPSSEQQYEFPIESRIGGTVDFFYDNIPYGSQFKVGVQIAKQQSTINPTAPFKFSIKEKFELKNKSTIETKNCIINFRFPIDSAISQMEPLLTHTNIDFKSFNVLAKFVGNFDEGDKIVLTITSPSSELYKYVWITGVLSSVIMLATFSISLITGVSYIYLGIAGILSCNPLEFFLEFGSYLSSTFTSIYHWLFRFYVVSKLTSLTQQRDTNQKEMRTYAIITSTLGLLDAFANFDLKTSIYFELLFAAFVFFSIYKAFSSSTPFMRSVISVSVSGGIDAIVLAIQGINTSFGSKSIVPKVVEIGTVGIMCSYMIFAFIPKKPVPYRNINDNDHHEVDLEGNKFELDSDNQDNE